MDARSLVLRFAWRRRDSLRVCRRFEPGQGLVEVLSRDEIIPALFLC